MDCDDRLATDGRDADPSAAFGVLVSILNLRLQLFHHWYSGRSLDVDEHWGGEVSVREQVGNMIQMHPDLIAAPRVFRIIRLDFDKTAVLRQAKVMRGFVVIKAHDLIASLIHIRQVMILRLCRSH